MILYCRKQRLQRQRFTWMRGDQVLLDELNCEGKLKNGDILAFSAFGAGFTSGACIIEWNK